MATALTPIAFFETVMVKSYETLVDSNITVDVNTGIVAAGRLQSLIDSGDYGREMLMMKVQLGQICDAVKSTVPQEMWGEIVEKLEEAQQQRSRSASARTPSITLTTIPSTRPSSSTRTTMSFDLRSGRVTEGDGDRCRCGRNCSAASVVKPETAEGLPAAGQSVDAVRPIRDDIEERVRRLLDELGITPIA